MRVLIKTRKELLNTHNVFEDLGKHIRRKNNTISFPEEKQQELCGKVVFCYSQNVEQERWNTITDKNTWTIESWMIKEILVE